MAPQNNKETKARASNETQVVRGVRGDGAIQTRSTEQGTILLQVARNGERAHIEMYAGSALKLAEELVRLARKAVLVEAREAA